MGNRSLILFLCLFLFLPLSAEENALDDWRKFSKTKSVNRILEFIRCNAHSEMNLKSCEANLPETPSFFGQLGIFITIVNKGKVRGCFGAFQHKNTRLAPVIQEYIRGALRDDPRYPPLEVEELKTAYFILTVADAPVPVVDVDSIALGRFGVFLAKETGQGLVYVPGEIKSHSVLKRIIRKEKIQDVNVFKAILIK